MITTSRSDDYKNYYGDEVMIRRRITMTGTDKEEYNYLCHEELMMKMMRRIRMRMRMRRSRTTTTRTVEEKDFNCEEVVMLRRMTTISKTHAVPIETQQLQKQQQHSGKKRKM